MANVQSVERAFSILTVLASGALSLTDIAVQTMLPKSTVARLLATLEDLGAVEREDEGMDYRIGARIHEFTAPTSSLKRLNSVVRPHLVNLAEALGEAIGFSVPEGYSVRFVAQVESPRPIQVRDYTDTMGPAHVGPSGLCMMADWPPDEIRRYLQRPLEAFTAHTVTDPELIAKRLEQLRDDGYCWVHEEFAEGLSSVAAPVRDSDGKIVGALHAHGPSYRFPAHGTADGIGLLMRDAAAHILVQAGPDQN
jgi:DNA-binding IclR family transcriptional regulator